ncbi:ATP-binding cassette domain-containing protein, partial [Acetobacter peroxydans]|uniref:ATP-binding cassette domain-containing protein n=1 Tax=Acetobacter peroxydans TaxID=104098 RepID=UPI00278BEB06
PAMTWQANAPPSILEACDLSIVRDGRRILDSVSFSIPTGHFVAVLGGNGAGKTTLFRAILGLDAPSHGGVRVAGHPPRPGQSAIGYMPQSRQMV